uniref:Uncharacterized protein n=1 Tax=Vespula pensylvanica TaxID=30213 RepID=A0A834JRW9_VESPE|nr:hypothetical protein H0235_017291 [Vespula pensylvanica]
MANLVSAGLSSRQKLEDILSSPPEALRIHALRHNPTTTTTTTTATTTTTTSSSSSSSSLTVRQKIGAIDSPRYRFDRVTVLVS